MAHLLLLLVSSLSSESFANSDPPIYFLSSSLIIPGSIKSSLLKTTKSHYYNKNFFLATFFFFFFPWANCLKSSQSDTIVLCQRLSVVEFFTKQVPRGYRQHVLCTWNLWFIYFYARDSLISLFKKKKNPALNLQLWKHWLLSIQTLLLQGSS